jgi:hypothetical protein
LLDLKGDVRACERLKARAASDDASVGKNTHAGAVEPLGGSRQATKVAPGVAKRGVVLSLVLFLRRVAQRHCTAPRFEALFRGGVLV